jgi:hypothetical protein
MQQALAYVVDTAAVTVLQRIEAAKGGGCTRQ